jgi:hypothetical protein
MDWLLIELPSFLRQIYNLIARKRFQNVSSMKEFFFFRKCALDYLPLTPEC